MAVILGEGEFSYEATEDWAKLPDGWEFGDAAAVGVDRAGPRLRLQPRRAPDDRVRPRRQLPALLGRGRVPARRTASTWGRTTTSICTDDGDHTVRKCTLDGKVLLEHRHSRQAGAVHERRAVPPLHAHRALARRATSTSRTATAMRASTSTRPDGKLLLVLGRAGHRARASSTSRTTSAATPTAGSMSPTARTTASRCSTATASTRRSGTTCTARAASTCRPAPCPICYVGEIGPYLPVNRELARTSARASASSTTRASCSARLGSLGPPARSPASSSRRTASPSTRAATSMSATWPLPPGRRCSPASRCPKPLRRMQKLTKVKA